MEIQQKFQTKLVQKLVLTPSLQQALKLLPMSTIELSELLNQEMVENPLLEEIPVEDAQEVEVGNERTDEQKKSEQDNDWDYQDYDYFFGEYLEGNYLPQTQKERRELPSIENTLSSAPSLAKHLSWQLSMQADDSLLRDISEAIIGNLDTDGMLVATVDEIAIMGPWSTADVEMALTLVQSLDPIGVGARNLQECLILQLRQLGMDGSPSEIIVTNYLHLLQNHKIKDLAQKLEMSLEEVRPHIEIIKHLDPKPGGRLNHSQSQYVIPDVHVVKLEDSYVIMLNDEGLPQLRISSMYRGLLSKNSKCTNKTRDYVKDKFRSALWLIKSVEQRRKTIHKTATSIINFQREFLDRGVKHLRPLVLREVADDIGMHESTVSRVVTNKYIHTPQGVFEMKYFFHSGIASSYGGSVSSITVKERMKKIIEDENPKKPLSDLKIVNILQGEGLWLARRTIAKYREALKIPVSTHRRVHY